MSACLALRLDLELVCRVPYLQGTDSGLWAHTGRGSEPTGEASIFSRAAFSEFCTLLFQSGSAALPTDV
jgi:hypothetical protein